MNYLVALQQHLESARNDVEAERMSAYMKGHFQFLGIKAPDRKRLLSSFLKQHGKPNREELSDVIIGLWSLPYREYQYCAMEIAQKVIKKPLPDDMLTVTYMLEYKQWWDTIDFIASNLVGHIFEHDHEAKHTYFNKWIASKDMWLNRTAILFQLKYKEKTDSELLTKAILPHVASKEFFHQKAIGWALRQYSKFNRDWVSEFINQHELAPLSKREASKYLN
ncbi:DNA alkylation repair protein [Fulvivirga sp. RKSG066]|uniref:DNA alkylation repair protein n=1 Tax=Fulvivirga aurantia TaxID=2529383 RepID=UPI0012BCF3B5|nr:DNA alkylation repair protein [Fulvivirga aurantia]